jgi:hypothetical protein
LVLLSRDRLKGWTVEEYRITVETRTIIRDVKVYGKVRTQIPTVMAKDLGIKDGDRVRWILESGTYLLEKSPPPRAEKFRPIAP